MSVIAVALTDVKPFPIYWSTPAYYSQLRSPIPGGLIVFGFTGAIPLLGAGDETNLKLTITLPDGYAYLLRNCRISIESDDLTNTFGVLGSGQYDRTPNPTPQKSKFEMESSGNIIHEAVTAHKIYTPVRSTPKLILKPADSMTFRFSDMDSGGSAAGDCSWYMEFYVFGLDQVDKWEVNSPIPTISHTSF